VHAQFPVAGVELAKADGVVVVLRVVRVDRADDLVGEIDASAALFLGIERVDRVARLVLDIFGERPRQGELDDDALEVDVLLAGGAEDFGDDALRAFALFGIRGELDDDLRAGLDVA
jgi:hypothetical protein